MKNVTFALIGLFMLMAIPANASAFSFGNMWDGLKEKVGFTDNNGEEPNIEQNQIYQDNAQNNIDSSGRVDTSANTQSQKQHRSQVQVMEHSGNAMEFQIQNMTQTRNRVNLAKKAGIVGKVALWGKDKDCENLGGTWYWEADKVGCVGIDGTYSRDHFMIKKAANMCIKKDASFVCDESGIYCAYI